MRMPTARHRHLFSTTGARQPPSTPASAFLDICTTAAALDARPATPHAQRHTCSLRHYDDAKIA